MSKSPFVYISSDTDSDSSDTEIKYYSDSSADSSTGWSSYFPPITTSSSQRNTKRKNPTNDPSIQLAKELPIALTQALETAVRNMNWSAQEGPSEKPSKPERPPMQVLFLPCPKMQASFEEKRKTAQKSKNSYKGKGKKPME